MKYFIIVASKDHVAVGVRQGFAQAGHGKKFQLAKLEKNDWIIYYSAKDKYQDGKACQKFTAVGQVADDEPFQVTVNPDFKAWRRKINYFSVNELEIRPILDDLNFITNRKKWGLHLMSGFVEITKKDLQLIAEQMLINKKP